MFWTQPSFSSKLLTKGRKRRKKMGLLQKEKKKRNIAVTREIRRIWELCKQIVGGELNVQFVRHHK